MPSKQHAWWDDVAMVGAWCGWQWVGLCQWKQDMGRLLTFLWPLLLAHFPGIIVSAVDSDDDLCHNRQMLWHIWEVPLTCHVVSATWCWGGGCLLGCCGWQCGIMASFLLWLVCRQQQLGGALSVETRYGGGCDLLVALATHSLPRHCYSLLLLLLWTATVTCGIMALLLLRVVLLVCAVVVVCSQTMVASGGSQWWQWHCQWWWWKTVVVLV